MELREGLLRTIEWFVAAGAEQMHAQLGGDQDAGDSEPDERRQVGRKVAW